VRYRYRYLLLLHWWSRCTSESPPGTGQWLAAPAHRDMSTSYNSALKYSLFNISDRFILRYRYSVSDPHRLYADLSVPVHSFSTKKISAKWKRPRKFRDQEPALHVNADICWSTIFSGNHSCLRKSRQEFTKKNLCFLLYSFLLITHMAMNN
jgi:hypothetical protein